MNVRRLMMIGSFALAAFVSQAETCTWSGGTWSAGSWDPAPPNEGDAVVIDNATADAMFVVDVDSVSISSLTFKSGGKPCYVTGGTFNISAQNAITAHHAMTISNNLVLAHAQPRLNADSGRSTYCGDVTLTSATGDFRTFGAGGSTFYGTVTIPRDFQIGGGTAWKYGTHSFYGPVACRNVTVATYYDNSTYTFYSTDNSWTICETGYYVKNGAGTAGALPATSVMRAVANDYYSGGAFKLNGTDQTVDRLSGTTKTLTVDGGTSAMTLTLRATASDESKALLNGSLSLVYAPTDPGFVQTINGGENTMNGTITVSNGTFKATGTATFRNVTAIDVEDGAVFDIGEAMNEGGLTDVREVVVGANGKFVMSANNATPFSDNAVTLRLSSSSEFTIPDGETLYVKDYYLDGIRQDAGPYAGGTGPFRGNGTVYAEEHEVPTVEATWDGGAGEGDTSLLTAENWEGDEVPPLADGGLLAHFANGGSAAAVDGRANFKGLAFDGSSQVFSLTGGETDVALLRELGLTVAANHDVTNAVTTEVKADQCWTIGSGARMNLNAPVTMAATYAVTNIGPGTIVFNVENDFKGPLHFGVSADTRVKLVVNVPTNAFGKASDELVTIWRADDWAVVSLNGTVVERPVAIKGGNEASNPAFQAHGTNRFTKSFTASGNFMPYMGDALIMEGGCNIQNWFMPLNGRMIVRNEPLNSGYSYFSDGAFQFECTGNRLNTLILMKNTILDCRCANAFSANTSMSGGQILLNGFDQGCTFASMTGGTVQSDTPAVLAVTCNSSMENTGTRFLGCAGLKLNGAAASTLTICHSQSSTNATVAVEKGTLAFSSGATWTGATNVVVSGTGRLVVADGRTVKNAVVRISDTGKIEILAGVTMRCAKLVVDGEEVTSGTFGSAESAGDKRFAEHFTGGGVMTVGTLGLMLLLR